MHASSFSEGDVVGFRRSHLGGMAEYLMLEVEGVRKYGVGPFRVNAIVEDRNGIQLHISTESGEEAILPMRWFISWKNHPHAILIETLKQRRRSVLQDKP